MSPWRWVEEQAHHIPFQVKKGGITLASFIVKLKVLNLQMLRVNALYFTGWSVNTVRKLNLMLGCLN